MSDNFKPMLAGKAPPSLTSLNYPVLVSPKLDGVRAIIRSGRVLSRNLLEIPCPTVQEFFGDPLFNGFDGELIVGPPTAPNAFRLTSSCVMGHGELASEWSRQLVFHVFDDWSHDGTFEQRLADVRKRIRRSSKIFKVVPHERVVNHHGVEVHEEFFLQEGYEGVMIRDPNGAYKFGRSTTREGALLKLKRFEDDEAVVIGYKELLRNENDDRTGGLAQRRSSKKDGKRGGGVLGALCVRRSDGVEFDVGSGFDAAERAALWARRDALVGQVVKYAFFPGGSKERPRFPTFLGFRDFRDL